MDKKIIIALTVLILATTALILTLNIKFTGNAIDLSEYSYTRAICDKNNFCQDYEIICKKEKVIGLIPITGAITQHDKNWTDPRNKIETKNLCKNYLS